MGKSKQGYLIQDKLREQLDLWLEKQNEISEHKKEAAEKTKSLKDGHDVIVKEIRMEMEREGKSDQKVTLSNGMIKILKFNDVLSIEDFKEDDENLPGMEE